MQLVRFFEFKFSTDVGIECSFYLTCTLGVFDYYYSNCMQLEECRQGDTKILQLCCVYMYELLAKLRLSLAWRIFCIHGLNCRERFSIKIYDKARLAHDPLLPPL